VRQAVKYALDYNALINQTRQGMAVMNQQFIAKGYFAYKDKNPYSYNVEKAKSLMKAAGQSAGFDVELVTNTNEIRRLEAQVVQENLAKIGIRTTINIMPAAQMYQKMRQQGINLIVAGWGIDFPDSDALAEPFANHKAKQLAWRMGWLDDKAAQLTEAAAKEMDDKKRAKLYTELTEYWQVNSPFATMFQPTESFVASKGVKGVLAAFEGYSTHADYTRLSK
ncbi:MAG TPA: ABC transporter substrate-binding protein, partial [Holophaga sp.]|nr:ABC transporter substrate-binding protein [Holophaga sp.]